MAQMSSQQANFAFATAMFISFIDQLGMNFLQPCNVPLGKLMRASNQQIAYFGLVRGLMLLVSTVWLSRCSDLTSRRLAVIVSMAGSAWAYITMAMAASYKDIVFDTFPGTNAGIMMYTFGRALTGFFGGTSPVLRAFVVELYLGNPVLQKQKLVMLQVAQQSVGLALAPVAGSIARLDRQVRPHPALLDRLRRRPLRAVLVHMLLPEEPAGRCGAKPR